MAELTDQRLFRQTPAVLPAAGFAGIARLTGARPRHARGRDAQ